MKVVTSANPDLPYRPCMTRSSVFFVDALRPICEECSLIDQKYVVCCMIDVNENAEKRKLMCYVVRCVYSRAVSICTASRRQDREPYQHSAQPLAASPVTTVTQH